MQPHSHAALRERLWPHLALSKSRIDTVCCLIIAMVSARTVNLSHLAGEMPGQARIASSYRRLQRFFQYVTLGSDWSARLIVPLLGLSGRHWYLCLDRTNWKIGTKDVNILMLAIVTRRFRVPLMWSVLDKFGSSNTAERIALMRRYLALFEASSIRLLLADREFVGDKWLEFLRDHDIPFVIRLKEDARIQIEDGRVFALRSFLRRCRAERRFAARLPGCNVALTFAAKRLKDGELLIVASNQNAHHALNAYRKRWAIECLFGDAKTRGLNIEDTRLTCARKLNSLLVLVALALAWANAAASQATGRSGRPRKNHGYYAKSWFRTGFDTIRKAIRTNSEAATKCWLKIPKINRVV